MRLYKAVLISMCMSCVMTAAQAQKKMTVWLTDVGNGVLFKEQPALFFNKNKDTTAAIVVDEGQCFQSIDGFGWALTGGSAQHIIRMSKAGRTALLQDLFAAKGPGIGGSYLRLSIGASDLNEKVFSYDDLPEGQTDTAMLHFDLGPDKQDVIPVLKEILAVNPAIKIMASPWSPPVWMKTNGDTRGGSLKPEYYAAYAKYFVRYIQEMKAQGITIDAITVQNEPLHPGNNPSLLMPAAEQGAFVKTALGPAFRRSRLATKIIIYDHNADRPDYPMSILADAAARPYIDGSAFHLYGGKIEALLGVHEAYPDKNLYFTEQWVGAPGNLRRDIREHINNLIIGATRNWCKTVIEWNLANAPDNKPHTDRGGCDRCLGAVTIAGDSVKRNPAYYIIAHAAKWVRPGAVRIGSTLANGLPNVAFKTPEGKTVLIVLNNTSSTAGFTIISKKRVSKTSLAAGAVATYVW